MFQCMECGRKFKTTKAAEKASYDGCPKCGGVDIDLAPVTEDKPVSKPTTPKFNPGDRVTWDMLDGNVMVGTVQDMAYDQLTVKRIDGTVCYLPVTSARPTKNGDFQAANLFFARIGS